jgi:TolB protein
LKTKFIHKSLIILGAILCVVPGRPYSASGKVYLDVDSPAGQQFVIAVPDFRNSDGGKGLPDNQAALLADQLSSFLRITAFFNVVNKAAYLEDNKAPANPSVENIRFADWLAIGAEYLVQGNFQQRGGDLTMDCRLYDVVKAEVVVGKKYAGKAVDGKNMLRKFAGEVLQALTGDGSVFSTRIAFVMKKGKATDILSISFDGSDLVKEIESKTILMSPRWSPEGRYLGFTSFEEGNPDFYVKDKINAAITKISSFRGINLSGGWSPDGKKVLVTLSKDGNEEIYLLDFGSKILQRLTNNYAIDVSPVWSPDGSRIAFVSNRSGSPQIYIMDADGNNAKRLTFAGNYNTSPAWAPKGDRIAYEGLVEGRFQILTIGADGENSKQLTFDSGESKSPSWSPDGRYLVFSKNNNGGKKIIYLMTTAGSNVRLLYEGAGDCVSASWSPRF